jgi:hypothetical protein
MSTKGDSPIENIEVHPDNAVSTIKCLCFLHNIVIHMECPLQELSSETGISLERNRRGWETTQSYNSSSKFEPHSNNISLLALDSQHRFRIDDLQTDK